MADDLDKEYRDLMDRKGEDTPTPEEAAGAQVEQQQQEFEAQSSPAPAQEKVDEAAAQPDPNKQAAPKDELPLDEIKKRWEDQKVLSKKEREARRAEAARAEAAEQRVQALESQLRQFMASVEQAQNQIPNPEEDVVGTVRALQAQLQQAQQLQQQQAAQRAQFEQQNRIATKIRTKVEDFESEFKAEHPDYDDALEYVLDLKEAEFEAVGYQKPQAQAAAAQWAMNAAAMMLRQGINPAEAGYKQAQLLGFRGKAAAPQQVDPAEIQRREAAAKIAQIKEGQAAGSKMSGGGNGSTGFDGSLKSIGQLEGAAFDAAAEKYLRQMTRG